MHQELEGLLKAGIDQNQQPIYIFVGNLIDKKNMEQIVQKLNSYLTTFRPFKQFIWIYSTQKDTQFKPEQLTSFLKVIAKNIANQQITRLNKFLIVSSSFQSNQISQIVPSKQSELYKNKITIIPNLNCLDDYEIQLHSSILKHLTTEDRYQQEQPFYPRDIQQYPISKTGVPVFLEEILDYFKKNDDFLKTEGVFRIPGSFDQEQELLEKLKLHDYQALHNYAPEVVATVLKNTLVNLKEPIFPFVMYETLRDDTKTNMTQHELVELFQVFFAYMPMVNRNTIKRLTEFLHHVAKYENQNLMGLKNLSIVFTPCFFRPKVGGVQDLFGAGKVVNYFLWLIQNVDLFLGEQTIKQLE